MSCAPLPPPANGPEAGGTGPLDVGPATGASNILSLSSTQGAPHAQSTLGGRRPKRSAPRLRSASGPRGPSSTGIRAWRPPGHTTRRAREAVSGTKHRGPRAPTEHSPPGGRHRELGRRRRPQTGGTAGRHRTPQRAARAGGDAGPAPGAPGDSPRTSCIRAAPRGHGPARRRRRAPAAQHPPDGYARRAAWPTSAVGQGNQARASTTLVLRTPMRASPKMADASRHGPRRQRQPSNGRPAQNLPTAASPGRTKHWRSCEASPCAPRDMRCPAKTPGTGGEDAAFARPQSSGRSQTGRGTVRA